METFKTMNPLSLLTGVWGYVAAAGVAAILAASTAVWATSVYYKSDMANLQASIATEHANNASEALTKFQDTAKSINEAAAAYAANQSVFDDAIKSINRDFANVKVLKPLPVACKPDASRLRVLTAAVTAANNAATRH